MLRRTPILFAVCAVVNGFQAEESARRADVYAIYSLMLTNPKTSHGADTNDIYLIGDTTVPGTPREPCVRAPAESASRLAEVLADFNQRKNSPRTLERAFTIAKPYRLLSAAEVSDFLALRSHRPVSNPDPLFANTPDLFRLTDVYFNRDRTLALTAISTWCSPLCARYQWKVFEKVADAGWEETPWVGCVTMAALELHQSRAH